MEIARFHIESELSFLRDKGFHLIAGPLVISFVMQRGFHPRLGARPLRDANEKIYAAQLRMRLWARFIPPHWSSSFALTNWLCGHLSRIRDQLVSRDDLRTRSEAASAVIREGGRGGTAGELCEDGADDHPLKQRASKLASLWGDRAGTQSRRAGRASLALPPKPVDALASERTLMFM